MTATLCLAVVCVAGSYLVGSVPFGLLLGKLKGVDIRAVGSGNIGATNLTRAVGRPWGVAAFVLDLLKGLVPVCVAPSIVGDVAWVVLLQILTGVAAILGHIFPVYLGFRGGKGVATTFGVMAALLPLSALSAAGSWGLVYLASRTVSVASLVAAAVFPLATLLFFVLWQFGSGDFVALESFSVAVAILILWRHKSNIQRLLKGEELRFKS